ncbi:MAG: hypothetical protein L3K00_08275 [Thermoplasmata archaeon]|nr:hypothetical protein [Thermoplasmata archaeon]
MWRREGAAIVLTVAAVALVIVAGELTYDSFREGPPPNASSFQLENVTGSLGATFARGAPQAFGFNGSTVLVTGVVGDPASSTIPFPLLGAFGGVPASAPPRNLSTDVAGLFHGGDTLGIGWNGSAWVITGEAAWSSDAGGAAAAWSDGVWTNLTPELRPFFGGAGGIWFDGWNGSSWLFGGQSDSGAALVSLRGSSVQDFSSQIPNNRPDHWIQFLQWNGTAWLVSGQGTLGVLTGSRYLDLEPQSPFGGGGAFAADWNGSRWLVGGGEPAVVAFLDGTRFVPGPRLPATFSWWVSAITWDGRGWYIGGEGSSASSAYDAALVYFDAATGVVVDLSALLPGAFAGGQIQFAGLAPFEGKSAVLLIGQGGLHPSATELGPSTGAAATVVRP